MSIVLRELSLNDEKAFYEGLQLFSDMDKDWFTFVLKDGMNYSEMLKVLKDNKDGVNIPENRVPDSMLYAFLGEIIIGRVSIRHQLNDYLFNEGGNIGYSVATTYRNRGFATEMLKQALLYCKEQLHLKDVLITCDDENIGSYKVIEKCGGKLEAKNISNDGSKIKRRYWIKL
jgi:predicted acetyltransferase